MTGVSGASNNIIVVASWDDEAQVWVGTSEYVPGLAAEASTFQKLIGKLQILIPELCELNSHLIDIPLERVSISADYQRFEQEIRIA